MSPHPVPALPPDADHPRPVPLSARCQTRIRDFTGYGLQRPQPHWPGQARIALQFVLNIEEGAESHVAYGDPASEVFLSDILGAQPYAARHRSIESAFEYGSRVGVWRILSHFRSRQLPLTAFATALALDANPAVAECLLKDGHEIASHGLRWIHHQTMPEAVEREHIAAATAWFRQHLGFQPQGWYTGRDSPQTRRLVVAQGGYLYDSDSYADELPYWVMVSGQPHLVLPYSLDCNDMRFVSSPGFTDPDGFYHYLKASFDCLYEEGASHPAMLSIGLHSRIIGRPGRISSLTRFLDYVLQKPDVWIARREDIARHWQQQHPFGTLPYFVEQD